MDDDNIDTENTPLLQNASASSSNANDYTHGGELRRRNKAEEETKEWVESQKVFISESGKKASIRKRLAFKFDTSRIGRHWELFDATLSIMFVILYIWNTQYVKIDTSDEEFPFALQLADFLLATIIFVQYLPHVWLDDQPFEYAFNFLSIITWVSVFPVMTAFILTKFNDVMDNTYMGAGDLIYTYPIRFIRLHLSMQIVFAPVKSSLFKFSKITRKAIKLVCTILFTFLAVTAFIHLVTYKEADENEDIEKISFYDAFFFTVLSCTNGMSTDLVPTSAFTRAIILYVIFAGALYLPSALSELLTLVQEKSKYESSYKGERHHGHIIVTGDFDATSLFEFLREFFCVDHGLATMNTYVVILHPDEPEEEVVEFLEDPAFVTRVQYIKGSPTQRRSLEKVKAITASAAFLLTKKFSENSDGDDANQVMRALAMKKFNKKLDLYAQVNLPENVQHFDFLAKDVICIEELSMGLIAQSLVVPGFSTLVVLLTTSVTNQTVQHLLENAKKKPNLSWAEEYLQGINNEIYAVTFTNAFVGLTFLKCSEIIYEQFGAALFGIGIYKVTEGCYADAQLGSNTSPFRIFLNPQDYIIQGDEIGYVICDNAEITVSMSNYQNPSKHWLGSVAFLAKSAQKLLFRHKRDERSRDINVTTPLHTQVNVEDNENPLSSSDDVILNQNIELAKACVDSDESEIKDMKEHILICYPGNNLPENLDIFLSVLREKNSSCLETPVVILSPSEESELEKQKHILRYGRVHFVEGSPLRRKDLYRAGVNLAKKCIVLSDGTGSSDTLYGSADSTSLMIALNIESLTKDCHVLVECIYRETFKMIGESDSVKNSEEDYIQAIMRPSFMAGKVFTPCNLDTMLCQCFYNRHIPFIMKRLIFSHEEDDKMTSPKIEKQSSKNNLGIAPGHMFQTDVPPSYIDKSYKELFNHLVQDHKAIPMGLYRTATHKCGLQSYIYMNPKPETIIKGDDKIYLITSKLPNYQINEGLVDIENEG